MLSRDKTWVGNDNGEHSFHGGIKLPGHKDLSTQSPIADMPACDVYTVPLNQHIGAEGEILVKAGDHVLKGQMLARPHGMVSAAIHSPVSGEIIEISNHRFPHPSGLAAPCFVIKNDHKDEWIERNPVGDDYAQLGSHELRGLIRDAGIVGLGGAGFPAAVKQTEVGITTLIINGVECEPYISCDDMLMREHADEIIAGAKIIAQIIKAENCVIAIEDNKPQAIDAVSKAINDDDSGFIELQVVPTIYPSGGERQLIKIITGMEVPMNGLPADIHVLCHNVATSYAIYNAIYHAIPLISRIVTITGHGVQSPQNINTAIGTPIKDCIEFCGGYRDDARALIMGGPMMGLTLDTDELPVIKTSNCLLVTTPEDMALPASKSHMPCIRCGKCVDVCPANLLPQQLYWYSADRDYDRAINLNLFGCIECGCCDYVCPSDIPLVQYFRHAKSGIWEQERERKKSDIARQRHENRQARQDKQKQEREERLRKKREALAKGKDSHKLELDKKKALIADALARVKEKKAKQPVKPKNTENLTEEQLEKIAEADRRRKKLKKERGDQDAV